MESSIPYLKAPFQAVSPVPSHRAVYAVLTILGGLAEECLLMNRYQQRRDWSKRAGGE